MKKKNILKLMSLFLLASCERQEAKAREKLPLSYKEIYIENHKNNYELSSNNISYDRKDGSINSYNVKNKAIVNDWTFLGYNNQYLFPNIYLNNSCMSLGKTISEIVKFKFEGNHSKDNNEILQSNIVINDGLLYILNPYYVLCCFDLKNKNLVWRKFIKGYGLNNKSYHKWISISQNKLVITTSVGEIITVDLQANEIWKRKIYCSIYSPPCIYNNKVFIKTINNDLYSLDLENGKILWSNLIGFSNSISLSEFINPCINNNVIINLLSSGEIYALDVNSGSLLWKLNVFKQSLSNCYSFIQNFYAQPVISGNTIYLTNYLDKSVAIDIISGIPVWKQNVGGIFPPLVFLDSIYVVSIDNILTRINKNNGSVIWSKPLPISSINTKHITQLGRPLIVNDLLFFIDNFNGKIILISPISGDKVNEIDLKLKLYGDPIIAEEKIITLSQYGEIIAWG